MHVLSTFFSQDAMRADPRGQPRGAAQYDYGSYAQGYGPPPSQQQYAQQQPAYGQQQPANYSTPGYVQQGGYIQPQQAGGYPQAQQGGGYPQVQQGGYTQPQHGGYAQPQQSYQPQDLQQPAGYTQSYGGTLGSTS